MAPRIACGGFAPVRVAWCRRRFARHVAPCWATEQSLSDGSIKLTVQVGGAA
jgi:hypothetical protein